MGSHLVQVLEVVLVASALAEEPFECPGHDDGWLYPDLDNCQCFWDCANGSPVNRCCGPGTLFDDANHICNYPWAVECGDRPMPGSTRPPPPTKPTEPPTEPTTAKTTTTTPPPCTDDASCNTDVSGICDVTNFPYLECSYCDEGECVPGCGSDDQCPDGYHCAADHMCRGDSGKVPLRSISLQTAVGCTNCTIEGVVVTLLGERNALYPDGVPCTTSVLDHLDTVDFAVNYTRVTFDGTLGGEEDEYEKNMMGSCYEAPLNGQLAGGSLSWVGNTDH